MSEGPCAGQDSINESMQFTWTHKDRVHPPPSKVADWSLQCLRSSQQGETPSYSSSLYNAPQMTPLFVRKKATMYVTVHGETQAR